MACNTARYMIGYPMLLPCLGRTRILGEVYYHFIAFICIQASNSSVSLISSIYINIDTASKRIYFRKDPCERDLYDRQIRVLIRARVVCLV